jgi:hypothetical protein
VGCSHDAKRENPLDPRLSPPVELTVAVDDTAGTVTLTWSASADPTFSKYLVLRKVSGLELVDTLATASVTGQTTYVDSFVVQNTTYSYRVSVVNGAGLEVPSDAQEVRPLLLPPVQIVRLEFDSSTATALLEWTPYAGPRFSLYQIYRTVGGDTRLLDTISNAESVSLVDTDLSGNTEYSYRIDVVTEIGEQIPSLEARDGFHFKVSDWPLELEAGPAFKRNVRLYSLGDRIAVLTVRASVATRPLGRSSTVRWLVYTSGGELLDDHRLNLTLGGGVRSEMLAPSLQPLTQAVAFT